MKRILIITLTALIFLPLSAIFNDYEPSPRARALGGAFYSISNDANGIFYNPAGLKTAGNNIMVGYSKLFNNDFQVLNSVAFSMNLPNNWGTAAFGMQSMDVDYGGVSLLSEKIYSLGHSFTILKDVHSEINLGYGLNFYHLSIETFGDDLSFGLNIGALAILHQRTKIGFMVANLNNPKVGEDDAHELPQKIAMGICYEPYDKVFTSLELKKVMDGKTEIHTGTEIHVFDMLTLRFGLRNQPTQYSVGARFSILDIVLDYAYSTHSTLKDTHHFGLGYKF